MLKKTVIFFALAVLFAALPLSVSASDSWHLYSITEDAWETEASYSYTNDGMGYENWVETKGLNASGLYQFNVPISDFSSDDGMIEFYYKAKTEVTLEPGDTFALSSFKGYVWTGGTNNYATAVRVVVGSFHNNPEFVTDWVESGYTDANYKAAFEFTIPDKTFTSTSNVTISRISIQIKIHKVTNGYINIRPATFTVGYGNYMYYEQLLEQKETNDKLDDLLKQPEKEKDDADNTGNSAADGVMGAIPGDSAGFTEGIRDFAQALSYSGTECAWTLPAISLPKIEGVMPAMQLTEEQPIDFAFWVQKIPGNVLEVVRLVLTIALVVYCFKELYSTISYFLTLKGGGKE